MSGLTAVSLFAGVGGIDLALERAGVAVKAAVEIDPACRGVLRRHFPQTALFNDVTKVTAREILAAGFVPGRGILAGGSPCQDLSIAGRRAGLGGARSGLFWHFMRLADELRPRWILFENVPGLLSAVCPCPGSGACVANRRAVRCGEWRAERVPGGPDLGPVCPGCEHDWDVHDAGGFCARCQDTCEGLPEVKVRKVWYPDVPHNVKGGACPGGCMPAHGGAMGTVLGALGHRGYGFAYRVLDAQFFGVPQRRARVFIAGCLGDGAAPVEVLLEPEGGDGHPAAGREAGPGAAAGAGTGAVATLQGGGRRGHRIDAEGAAGGHLVPVVTPVALRGRDGGSNVEVGEPGDPAFTVRTPGGGSSYPMIAQAMAFNPQTGGSAARLGYGEIPTALQASQVTAVHVAATLSAGTATGEGVRPPGRHLEDDVNLVAVTALGGEGVDRALAAEGADASEDGAGRGTPIVAYALTSRDDRDDRDDREENWVAAPVVPDVAGVSENQRGEVLETPYSRQLTTGGGKPGQGYGAVRQDTAVRRLTPLECERLMGFPEITKSLRIEVWNCSGHPKNLALADSQNPRSQKSASNADALGSRNPAQPAGSHSRCSRPGPALPVVASVQINCEAREAQISSPDGNHWSVNGAALKSSSPLATLFDVSARLFAPTPQIQEQAMSGGRAASPPCPAPSTPQPSGVICVPVCGLEIGGAAGAAHKPGLGEASRSTSITPQAGRATQNSGLTWTTLCCSALAAIGSFIPLPTAATTSYAVELTASAGWTRWLDDGTEQSDSARYRQCGNAVAVCVAEWIARRVVAVDGAAQAEGAA